MTLHLIKPEMIERPTGEGKFYTKKAVILSFLRSINIYFLRKTWFECRERWRRWRTGSPWSACRPKWQWTRRTTGCWWWNRVCDVFVYVFPRDHDVRLSLSHDDYHQLVQVSGVSICPIYKYMCVYIIWYIWN